MKFLIRELLKFFSRPKNKIKIGFVINDIRPYNTIMASTRVKVYDIINEFIKDQDYFLELYKPWKIYDILIFQKKFDKRAYKIAKKNKQAKIILDINVNYYSKNSKEINFEQNKNIIKFTKITDEIITTTKHIQKIIQEEFPNKNVKIIHEPINEKFLNKNKTIGKVKQLVWSGYSIKAKEIKLIKKTLLKIYKKHKFTISLICEKNPHIKIGNIPIKFIKYNNKIIEKQLSKCDIFIAPRNLNKEYNKGHSFTKIGVAMAMGIPVIASPIESYIESPAIICKNNEEWKNTLEQIFSNKINLNKISEKGKIYCQNNYSIKKIKKEYEKLFKRVIK